MAQLRVLLVAAGRRLGGASGGAVAAMEGCVWARFSVDQAADLDLGGAGRGRHGRRLGSGFGLPTAADGSSRCGRAVVLLGRRRFRLRRISGC